MAAGLIADVNKAGHLGADSSISPVILVVLFGVGTDYFLFLFSATASGCAAATPDIKRTDKPL